MLCSLEWTDPWLAMEESLVASCSITRSGMTKFSEADALQVHKSFFWAKQFLVHTLLDVPWSDNEFSFPVFKFVVWREALMHSDTSRTVPDCNFQIPVMDQNPTELVKSKLLQMWTLCPHKSSSLQSCTPLVISQIEIIPTSDTRPAKRPNVKKAETLSISNDEPRWSLTRCFKTGSPSWSLK